MNKEEFMSLDRTKTHYFTVSQPRGGLVPPSVAKSEYFNKGYVVCQRLCSNARAGITGTWRGTYPYQMLTINGDEEKKWKELWGK